MQRYRRKAPQFASQGPLLALMDAVPELSGKGPSLPEFGSANRQREGVETRKSLFRRKDSNLRKRNQNPLSCH